MVLLEIMVISFFKIKKFCTIYVWLKCKYKYKYKKIENTPKSTILLVEICG